MPSMKNRDPYPARPKAGPADDATRKRMLKERLAEKEPAGLYAKPAAEPTPPKTVTLNPVRNLKERQAKIDQAIKDAGG